jgi:hypothetical protein
MENGVHQLHEKNLQKPNTKPKKKYIFTLVLIWVSSWETANDG